MHDRAVRRRRAVLVVLVAASLILLTAYFGESQDGRLHSAQRGALGALSPIQEGASRVLKPFRDLFGWFGDTIDAKDQRDKAEKERDALRTQLADAPEPPPRGRAAGADQRARHDRRDEPLRARRRARLPALAEQLVPEPARSTRAPTTACSAGDPVINGAGLVGKVETATGGSAVVTLITDPEFATGGITSASREPGSVVPRRRRARRPAVQVRRQRHQGEARARSSTPPARPRAGSSRATRPRSRSARVDRIDIGDGELDRRIHIKPAADLKRVDMVQVLTEPHADLDAK